MLIMQRKCEGDIRSVMPFDILGCTRATMLQLESGVLVKAKSNQKKI